ncbi:MAG: hypothetical protein HY553_08945 [Elusimicrobia bacterium]|nr:hypothetical protein [Elusimicrobiota bacterium]
MVSVLDIPRSYRRAMLTHLVMVGHEVGHIEDHAVGRIGDRFKRETIVGRVVTGQAARILPALRPLRKSSASLVLELIRNWSPEVFCDLYCIRRLGPAGLLVFAEYGRVAGIFLGDLSRRRSEDGKEDVEERFREHPPGEIRIALMIEELVALGYTIGQSPLDGPYGKIVAGWREVTGGGRDALVRLPEEFGRAYRLIRGHIHGPLRQELIRRIPDAQAYGPARLAYARTLAADLAQGIAMSERIEADGSRTILEVEDLYNAAAFVRFVQLDELAARVPGDERLSREQRRGAALETLDLLLTRAIEGARIAADWAEASSAIKARRR